MKKSSKCTLEVPFDHGNSKGILHFPVETNAGEAACVVFSNVNPWLTVDSLQEVASRVHDVLRLTINSYSEKVYFIQNNDSGEHHYAMAETKGGKVILNYLSQVDFIRLTGVRYKPHRITEDAIAAIAKLIRSASQVQEQMQQILIEGEMAADVARTYLVSPSAISQAIRRYEKTNKVILEAFGNADSRRYFEQVRTRKSMHIRQEQA